MSSGDMRLLSVLLPLLLQVRVMPRCWLVLRKEALSNPALFFTDSCAAAVAVAGARGAALLCAVAPGCRLLVCCY
jgi:hypothetical protein